MIAIPALHNPELVLVEGYCTVCGIYTRVPIDDDYDEASGVGICLIHKPRTRKVRG